MLLVGCATTPMMKSLVGSYELSIKEDTTKLVLLENGKVEIYFNGEKIDEETWKVVGTEVHIVTPNVTLVVWKIEPNGDLTWIAHILDGKRDDYTIEDQLTLKKLK